MFIPQCRASTYSKLADFDIVNTENLLLLASAELEDGKEFAQSVKDTEDHACTEERVGTASQGVGDLVSKLDPVMVEPATIDDRITIKMSNVVTRVGISYRLTMV